MALALKKEKGKSRRISEKVRAEILSGRLRPGDRVRSVRELAERFSVSPRSAQIALDALVEEGLIERKHGSGTFVKEREDRGDNTIYFLVPNACHLALNHETSVMLRQLLYGVTRAAAPGQLVQPLPVSKVNVPSISKSPEAIDWDALERVPPGANVFVSGTWYDRIVPFLTDRGARGVFLSLQYDREYPRIVERVRDAGWETIVADRRDAIRRVAEYLNSLGRTRVAAIKRFQNQPDHPFRAGFLDAGGAGPALADPRLFLEYPPSAEKDHWEDMIFSLWQQTRFDALILCAAELAATAYAVLTDKIGLKIPDDIAVIAYRDLPEHLERVPRLSAFDFPWVEIGAEITRTFNAPNPDRPEPRFRANIIERGSTRKNAEGQSIFRELSSQGNIALPEMA